MHAIGNEHVPIIIVDNGSTDDTQDVVRAYSDKVACIFEPNQGLSRARNRALVDCVTKYIVYLDDDGIPDLTWCRAIIETTSRDRADVFGGPYYPFFTTPKPDWFLDEFGSAHLDLVDGPQPHGTCFSGGNMGWRTELLRSAGGFDEALGMDGDALRLGEETALQLRLHASRTNLIFFFSSQMRMAHHVAPEKMTLRYIHRRNYIYGWQLRDIDPSHSFNQMSPIAFARATKCGVPLAFRALVRDRRKFPNWSTYAAKYLSINSILIGVQARRMSEWRTGRVTVAVSATAAFHKEGRK